MPTPTIVALVNTDAAQRYLKLDSSLGTKELCKICCCSQE